MNTGTSRREKETEEEVEGRKPARGKTEGSSRSGAVTDWRHARQKSSRKALPCAQDAGTTPAVEPPEHVAPSIQMNTGNLCPITTIYNWNKAVKLPE
jgi:hypothetical protein